MTPRAYTCRRCGAARHSAATCARRWRPPVRRAARKGLAQRFAARIDDRAAPFLWPLREAVEVFRLGDGSRWQRLACGHAMLLDHSYRAPFPLARRCRPCGAAGREVCPS